MVKSNLVKLETSCRVILPPTESVLWSNLCILTLGRISTDHTSGPLSLSLSLSLSLILHLVIPDAACPNINPALLLLRQTPEILQLPLVNGPVTRLGLRIQVPLVELVVQVPG